MPASYEQPVHTVPSIAHPEERDLCTRIQAEFHEMPGLTLTLPQAYRLFRIEPLRCERVSAHSSLRGTWRPMGRHSSVRAAAADRRDFSAVGHAALSCSIPLPARSASGRH